MQTPPFLPAYAARQAGVTASGRGVRGCGLLVGGFLAGIGFRSRMGAARACRAALAAGAAMGSRAALTRVRVGRAGAVGRAGCSVGSRSRACRGSRALTAGRAVRRAVGRAVRRAAGGGCSPGGCPGGGAGRCTGRTGAAGRAAARRAARAAGAVRRAAGAYAADRHIQDVAGNGAAVVACHCVHLKGRIEHGGVDLHLDGGLARRLRHFRTVGVPADAVGSEVLAAQLCGKGVGIAQHGLAGAADMHGSRCKHGGHVHVLLEVRIGAGLLGHAVAPLDEHIARCRDRRDADRLACTDAVGQCGLAVVIAGAQGTTAGLIHAVGCLILGGVLLHFGRRGGHLTAGRSHSRTGVGHIFGAAGDVVGVRAAVLGLIGVGAQILQQHLPYRLHGKLKSFHHL